MTIAEPPTDVSSGPTTAEVMLGQLSPSTSVAVTPMLPVAPGWLPVPQVRVIVTAGFVPASTGNGALVPVQLSPVLVVAVRLTVSPASPVGVTGTTMSSETVACGSLTLKEPPASWTLLDDRIL